MILVPLKLKKNSNILISGCGGGFDVTVGIPLALELERRGHHVVFSSYSFTDLSKVNDAAGFGDDCIIIDSDSWMPTRRAYCPEKHMCDWLAGKGLNAKVYSYQNLGVPALKSLFNRIAEAENIDCHFVVDGGADGIFRGDEYGLGSPLLDGISILAASGTRIQKRHYVLSAFGTEGVGNNDVSHAQVLERMSELIAAGKMQGVTSLVNYPEIAGEFTEAFEYICAEMSTINRSTIVGSIIGAMKGEFGNAKVNSRTVTHPVWLSPLTTLLWYFDLDAVAAMKIYGPEVSECDSPSVARSIIWDFWKRIRGPGAKRPHIPI